MKTKPQKPAPKFRQRFHFQIVGIVSYGGETFEYPKQSYRMPSRNQLAAAHPPGDWGVPREQMDAVLSFFAEKNKERLKAKQPEIAIPRIPMETTRCVVTGSYDETGVHFYSPDELRKEVIALGFSDDQLIDRHEGPRETTSGVLEILPR